MLKDKNIKMPSVWVSPTSVQTQFFNYIFSAIEFGVTINCMTLKFAEKRGKYMHTSTNY